MKKLELELHKLANEEMISRKIITLSYAAQEKVYRSLVEVSNTNVNIQTYLYIPGENLSEDQVCRIILALAVAYYLGKDIDGVRRELIAEAKESDQTDSKEEAAPVKKPAKKKASAKKVAKKVSDKEPKGEEEEVEEEPKPKRQEKPKTIPYDRNQTEHKKELSKILGENFPKWHEDKEIVARAKAVSEQLVGVAIFDNNGEVLPTFTENVLELMKESDEAQVDL